MCISGLPAESVVVGRVTFHFLIPIEMWIAFNHLLVKADKLCNIEADKLCNIEIFVVSHSKSGKVQSVPVFK